MKDYFKFFIFCLLLAGFLSGYSPAYAQGETTLPIILPHPGYLSTKFSNYHPGVDIAIDLGMPIHPINPGIVENVIYSLWDYGNHVVIDHQNGYKSLYAHMGRIYVKKGGKVTSANIIGEVGLTGRTSGPHTHLEIIKNGDYIDPMTILPSIDNLPLN